MLRAVGRESEAHPAFCVIPSLDAERYHLPPLRGYKYRFEHNGGSLNKANPQPSSRDRALRIVVEVINVTLILTLVADGVFPKASLPDVSFSLLQAPR
jgi:hypothetical protein